MSLRHKILFISSWFPNKIKPQDGNFVQRHAEAVSLLHDVQILHAEPNPGQKPFYQLENRIINNIRTVVVYYRDAGNPVINNLRKFSAYQKGYRLLEKPELVHGNVLHTNLLFALWLKKTQRIPYIVTEHFTDYRPVNLGKLTLQQKFTARLIGNQAAAIAPVTKELQEGLRLLGINTHMAVVPNVVNTKTFFPVKSDANQFTFLHISNLEPRKNPLKILQGANELLRDGYDFHLEIGGNATFENNKRVMEYISNSGFNDKIKFFGMLSSEEVAQKMNNADCFILYSEDENQPCVISEAFATGLPVISSDVGGISEFFPDYCGFLIKGQDVDLLKEAMIKMLSKHSTFKSEEISLYAKNTFSKEKIAHQFSEIYDEILNEEFF